ncbi:unnamed protein product, partial [Prorocentrum cordatum]
PSSAQPAARARAARGRRGAPGRACRAVLHRRPEAPPPVRPMGACAPGGERRGGAAEPAARRPEGGRAGGGAPPGARMVGGSPAAAEADLAAEPEDGPPVAESPGVRADGPACDGEVPAGFVAISGEADVVTALPDAMNPSKPSSGLFSLEDVIAAKEAARRLLPTCRLSEWQECWCTQEVVSVYLRGRQGDPKRAGQVLARALLWRQRYEDVLSGARVPRPVGDMRVIARSDSGHPISGEWSLRLSLVARGGGEDSSFNVHVSEAELRQSYTRAVRSL